MSNPLQAGEVSAVPQYNWGLGYMLLGFTALTWGINFPIMKLGLHYSPPLLMTLMRMALGTITMFVIAAWMRNLRLPERADWPVLLSVGVLQNMAFITLVTLGLTFMPAGKAAILAYTSPIWVVPAAALFLGERFTLPRAIGVGLGIGGLALILDPMGLSWDNPDTLIGGGLIMLATFLWTLGLVHVRRHHWQGNVLSLIPWQLLVSVVVLIPVAFIWEDASAISWDVDFAWQLFFSGVVASGICVAAQVAAIRALPAVSLSLSSAAVPAVGLLSSALFLNEQPSHADLAGFLLIALGILTVGLADRRQAIRTRRNASAQPAR